MNSSNATLQAIIKEYRLFEDDVSKVRSLATRVVRFNPKTEEERQDQKKVTKMIAYSLCGSINALFSKYLDSLRPLSDNDPAKVRDDISTIKKTIKIYIRLPEGVAPAAFDWDSKMRTIESVAPSPLDRFVDWLSELLTPKPLEITEIDRIRGSLPRSSWSPPQQYHYPKSVVSPGMGYNPMSESFYQTRTTSWS